MLVELCSTIEKLGQEWLSVSSMSDCTDKILVLSGIMLFVVLWVDVFPGDLFVPSITGIIIDSKFTWLRGKELAPLICKLGIIGDIRFSRIYIADKGLNNTGSFWWLQVWLLIIPDIHVIAISGHIASLLMVKA